MSNNKQSMKLYTEEQIFKYLLENGTIDLDSFILDMKPIELPSDEEIKKYTPYPLGKGFYNPLYSNKWEEGAKWMRNKIQGGEQ
jgi:hypothetical protein